MIMDLIEFVNYVKIYAKGEMTDNYKILRSTPLQITF